MKTSQGFTLIEILLTLFIFALIAMIGVFATSGASYISDIVRTQTDTIIATLRKAQVASLMGQTGAPFKVQFAEASVTILPTNEILILDGVTLPSITLQGGGSAVTFSTDLGKANPSGQITVLGNRGGTRTIIISPSGTIDWQIP